MRSPDFKKVFFVTGSRLGSIPLRAVQSGKHTCMYMNSSTQTCLPDPRGHFLPPSLNTLPTTTLCIQSSSLKQQLHPSAWRLMHPRLWSHRYTRTHTHTHTNFLPSVWFLFKTGDTFMTSQAGMDYWTGLPASLLPLGQASSLKWLLTYQKVNHNRTNKTKTNRCKWTINVKAAGWRNFTFRCTFPSQTAPWCQAPLDQCSGA